MAHPEAVRVSSRTPLVLHFPGFKHLIHHDSTRNGISLAQFDRPFLDASAITRDRSQWSPISRGEALQACRSFPVAVLHRALSREAASWFDGSSRYYKADGPYLYESLRYFLFTGRSVERGLLKGLIIPPKPKPMEWEAMEALDQATGEFLSLGSPTTKVPPKPVVPKTPKPPDASFPEIPGKPEIPTLPAILTLPTVPTLPVIPDLPVDLKDNPLIPIEFRLLDGKGNPMPPTPFKVTLPDGTAKTGKSDKEGFIRIPDNRQKGQAKLELLDADESDPAKLAAFAPTPTTGKKPIEVKLTDSKGAPMADKAFLIKLPDGSEKKGKSDSQGFIRIPDNTQDGEFELVLTEFSEKAG